MLAGPDPERAGRRALLDDRPGVSVLGPVLARETRAHIWTLYKAADHKKRAVWCSIAGSTRISDMPSNTKLTDDPAAAASRARSRRAHRGAGAWRRTLEPFESPLGIPRLRDCQSSHSGVARMSDHGAGVAQFSYHEEQPDGTYPHVGWLAEGPGDPRRELAEAMIEATAGAGRIVIFGLREDPDQGAGPGSRSGGAARGNSGKLVDLLPVMRNNVYHPDFRAASASSTC